MYVGADLCVCPSLSEKCTNIEEGKHRFANQQGEQFAPTFFISNIYQTNQKHVA